MRAKAKFYLETIFHGIVEGLGFFPVFLMLAVLFLSQGEIIFWFFGLLLLFFINFLFRSILTNERRWLSLITAAVIVTIFSFLFYGSILAITITLLMGSIVAYRGIQHAEKEWELLMPCRIFWMISIPVYFVGFITFVFSDRLVMYKSWISIAGFMFIIFMVLITNQQKLHHASFSKEKQKKVGSEVKRLNQIYLFIILSVVFLLANFQTIQSTIYLSVKSLLGNILSVKEGSKMDPEVGVEQPASPLLDLKLGDGTKATSLPAWLDNVLWIIGFLIVIGLVFIFAAIFLKKFRNMARSFFSWFLNLFSQIFNSRQKEDSLLEYEDEKESLFDFKKFRKEMKGNYQGILRKITNRKPKFEQMSIEEKVRYIYRFLASEVKQQEQWHASLTAHEVLQLNQRKKKLDLFKKWYEDIRYGKIQLEEFERKQVDNFWLQLNQNQ